MIEIENHLYHYSIVEYGVIPPLNIMLIKRNAPIPELDSNDVRKVRFYRTSGQKEIIKEHYNGTNECYYITEVYPIFETGKY